MWNICNSNFAFGRCGGYSGCSSSSNYGYNYGCSNGLFSLSGQRVCRDACGNLRVQNGCCNSCHSCNSCHCGCNCCGSNGSNGSNSGTSGNTTGNGSGGFTCVTFCGNSTNSTAQTTSTTSDVWDAYYSRQYGLNSRSGRRSCCGCNYGCTN